MNLKSYMRGLGIGIIVTAILMGIGNNKAEKVTVAEENNATVLSDLKELSQEASSSSSSVKKQQEQDDKNNETGKNDSAVSADEVSANGADKAEASDSSSEKLDKDIAISSSDDKQSDTDKKNDNDKNKVSTVLPKAGELADDGQAPRDDKKKSDNKDLNVKEDSEKTDSNKSTTGEIIDITIVSGQGSDAIARECERLGLVEEASAFDKFLNSYGYDRKLTTGVHHIPMGSTEAQIAEILTKKGE